MTADDESPWWVNRYIIQYYYNTVLYTNGMVGLGRRLLGNIRRTCSRRIPGHLCRRVEVADPELTPTKFAEKNVYLANLDREDNY